MATHVKKPKRGDLIKIFRGHFPIRYQHWAVYVGKGSIVHVASNSDVSGASADSLKSVTTEKAIVKKEKLMDVVGNDWWEISNSLDRKYKPRQARKIVREASAKVGKKLPYSVLRGNCEHFVNELRYGKSESQQAEDGKTFLRGSVAAGLYGFFLRAMSGGDNEENENTDTETS